MPAEKLAMQAGASLTHRPRLALCLPLRSNFTACPATHPSSGRLNFS